MRTIRIASLLLALAMPTVLSAQDKPNEPSGLVILKVENNALKAEVVQLRLTVARLSAELEVQQIAKERAEIEAIVGKEAPAYAIDWKTGQLKPKSETPAKTGQ